MKKFAIIIDEETREYFVGNQIELEEKGFPEVELELSYDGRWYEIGYAPEQSIEEYNKEQEEKRSKAYLQKTDPLTMRKIRKQALGNWTDEDEVQYINEIKMISEEIENEFPYKEVQ